MRKQLTDFLGQVAPSVARALGGPLAGVATRAISEKLLGKSDASSEEVERAVLGASTAEVGKLTELEDEFRAEMEAAGVDLERIAAGDRADARARQAKTGDWTPSVLGGAIVLGFFALLAWLVAYGMPEGGGEVLLILMGALAGMVTQIGNYFFGSSTGSKNKDRVIADLKGALK